MEEKKLDVFERALLFLGNATCANNHTVAIGLKASDREEEEACFRLRNPAARSRTSRRRKPK